MIKCEAGKCQVKGTPYETIFDLNQVIESFYKYHPEMTTCVLAHWSDVAADNIHTLNKSEFHIYSELQDHLVQFLKENRADEEA